MKCTSVNIRNVLDISLKKKIKENTNLSDDEIIIIYKRFNYISSNGKLNYDNFEKSLGILGSIQNAYLYKSIFKAFDLNNDNYLDFYEFCVAINIMLKGNKKDKLKLSYRIVNAGFNSNEDACVHKSSCMVNKFNTKEDNNMNGDNINGDNNNNHNNINDYSNYITYENFEKIVLSINDIKRQLLGTGDEIITSQIKYTFRSLSILCDDGIYRMNFECYKKALKCNEFLKLLGIHTKVADVFLQHELLKRKDKNKTKNGTMRNRKKYKNDSNRIANHLIIKSFSEKLIPNECDHKPNEEVKSTSDVLTPIFFNNGDEKMNHDTDGNMVYHKNNVDDNLVDGDVVSQGKRCSFFSSCENKKNEENKSITFNDINSGNINTNSCIMNNMIVTKESKEEIINEEAQSSYIYNKNIFCSKYNTKKDKNEPLKCDLFECSFINNDKNIVRDEDSNHKNLRKTDDYFIIDDNNIFDNGPIIISKNKTNDRERKLLKTFSSSSLKKKSLLKNYNYHIKKKNKDPNVEDTNMLYHDDIKKEYDHKVTKNNKNTCNNNYYNNVSFNSSAYYEYHSDIDLIHFSNNLKKKKKKT
ncbi:hypothetical protein PFMC_00087 [Plasmodium falciparum CAMP/Malaysia]|uniref:EF-hand domain-containing protein n=1 Tax=Plasmodium falciparum (isolate Camp / Malaysia) TaxID=5835 RepID=A0A024XF11_PLAFC|nr:hypothetical protein PFMC_00087 [Plasmodium falciparum CAMP/Malaysia]